MNHPRLDLRLGRFPNSSRVAPAAAARSRPESGLPEVQARLSALRRYHVGILSVRIIPGAHEAFRTVIHGKSESERRIGSRPKPSGTLYTTSSSGFLRPGKPEGEDLAPGRLWGSRSSPSTRHWLAGD